VDCGKGGSIELRYQAVASTRDSRSRKIVFPEMGAGVPVGCPEAKSVKGLEELLVRNDGKLLRPQLKVDYGDGKGWFLSSV
jgi:hypothetical protein